MVLALVFSWCPHGEAATIVGFTGPYAPENWTATDPLLTYFSFSPGMLTLQARGTQWVHLHVNIPEESVISFDWELVQYPVFDTMSFVRGAVDTTGLSYLFPGPEGKGTVSFRVPAGDKVTFAAQTFGGRGDLIVSNFRAESVPEPSAIGLLATGLVGILGTRRRRRMRKGTRGSL